MYYQKIHFKLSANINPNALKIYNFFQKLSFLYVLLRTLNDILNAIPIGKYLSVKKRKYLNNHNLINKPLAPNFLCTINLKVNNNERK